MSDKTLEEATEDFAVDVIKRAAHTFWQAFAAGISMLWIASGLGVEDLADLAGWQKVVSMLAAAAGAAAMSMLKSLWGNAKLKKRAKALAAKWFAKAF